MKVKNKKIHFKIKKGDTVIVIAGKEKGKKGKVLRVIPKHQRVIVEGVNFIKKHQRPTQRFQQGGIIEKEGPIHISNVMLICPRCNNPTRVGYTFIEGDRKVRFCKKCEEIIEK